MSGENRAKPEVVTDLCGRSSTPRTKAFDCSIPHDVGCFNAISSPSSMQDEKSGRTRFVARVPANPSS